jgi:hypothetical protein
MAPLMTCTFSMELENIDVEHDRHSVLLSESRLLGFIIKMTRIRT